MASFNTPSLSSDESFVSSSAHFPSLLCCSAYVDSRLQLGTLLTMVLSSFLISSEAMVGMLSPLLLAFFLLVIVQ